MRSSFRRYWVWLFTGVALAVLVAVVGVAMITRTDWGRERILAFTLTALGGRLNGELTVERLDGNVLSGARLYRITLVGADGVPLLQADSAFIEYKIPSFVGGDVLINRLAIYDSRLLLVRMPGDSLWNYQAILQDTTGQTSGRAARVTLIEHLRLVRSHVTVRLPWLPDERLSPAAQRREAQAALTDTSRLVVDSVAAGLVRTMVFRVEAGLIADLSVAPPERGGISLKVDSAQGEAFLYTEPPLRIRHIQGELVLREGILRYRAPNLVLSESRVSSLGVVDATGAEAAYDLAFESEQMALADLHWLFPTLPDEGGGRGKLWIETRPEGLSVLGRDLAFEAPGTRIRGSFGMVFGDTLRFLEADLAADPLDIPTVERMIPAGLPVEGLRIGALEIRSGAS